MSMAELAVVALLTLFSACTAQLTELEIEQFSSRSKNVTVTSDAAYLTIGANGWPDHDFGQFPAPDGSNPNSIKTQRYRYVMICD